MGFPSIFSGSGGSGGGEKGQAYYAVTESGKVATHNSDFANDNEAEVMRVLGFLGEASATKILKEAELKGVQNKSAAVQVILQSLKGRKLIMKVN